MTGGEVARFAADLAALSAPGERIGLAVSGGPDSLALLLLAAAARPGMIAAATVDHRLRPEARAEAEQVAAICGDRAVPHAILSARWTNLPTANLQARARDERYALLADWGDAEGLAAIATAHHADDQAETLLMRLARGSGIAGLGGVRPSRPMGERVALIRPLLKWRKSELAEVVATAGLAALDDPANRDPRHDRARTRQWLADNPGLDPLRLAASAAWLREADDALEWITASLREARLTRTADAVTLDPSDIPPELRRRLLLAAFSDFGAAPPSGPDLSRALAALRLGDTVTLAGIKLVGGERWRLTLAPPRTRRG
ncbi:MAG: tRNA lysidine(34) synthetase TilS [Sphingomicrobium sp.]